MFVIVYCFTSLIAQVELGQSLKRKLSQSNVEASVHLEALDQKRNEPDEERFVSIRHSQDGYVELFTSCQSS